MSVCPLCCACVQKSRLAYIARAIQRIFRTAKRAILTRRRHRSGKFPLKGESSFALASLPNTINHVTLSRRLEPCRARPLEAHLSLHRARQQRCHLARRSRRLVCRISRLVRSSPIMSLSTCDPDELPPPSIREQVDADRGPAHVLPARAQPHVEASMARDSATSSTAPRPRRRSAP